MGDESATPELSWIDTCDFDIARDAHDVLGEVLHEMDLLVHPVVIRAYGRTRFPLHVGQEGPYVERRAKLLRMLVARGVLHSAQHDRYVGRSRAGGFVVEADATVARRVCGLLDDRMRGQNNCIWTVPEGDGWGGCASCSASKCCSGSAPVYAQGGSTTIPANANNGTYTVSFALTYSGACNTSDGQVSNFTGVTCHSYSMDLQWTAPSDSGCTVVAYDVRYSTSAINEGNWASATTLNGEPTPATPGSTEPFTATLPYPCTLYYFGIKAQRRNGSYSPLTTTCAGTLCEGSSECGICD